MLITSISGIRGTIGGQVGENLTPIDVVSFISAYGTWILQKNEIPAFAGMTKKEKGTANRMTIVIGRDARQSGDMIMNIAVSTLQGFGINVVRLDLATTPTVEMEVIRRNANGGIIITASHNPKEYNGIKMLNNDGEFLSAQDGTEILKIVENKDFNFASVEELGEVEKSHNHTKQHIDDILNLDLVDVELVSSKRYKVVVDAINSVGGIAVPYLLEKMGVEVVGLNINPNGEFAHKPEPLEENLGGIKSLVEQEKADLGIVVDPDVDRLVLINEQGKMFGEEYTIVSITDYVLSEKGGNTVSNLSSSRALADVTQKYGGEYFASAVGEKNVVEKMKEVNATIGGEGSGGVIYPPLHYGRDALVGIALFMAYMAKRDSTASQLRAGYPDYYMTKRKVVLDENIDVDAILKYFWKIYQPSVIAPAYRSNSVDRRNEAKWNDDLSACDDVQAEAIPSFRLPEFSSGSKVTNISNIDGVKIDFENSWVHLRKSNTEPIMRIFTEAQSQNEADTLAEQFMNEISNLNKL